ncbi:MAG: response regulator [Reichenbachiella sp.]|uniref:response regulator n=1 Tax=Reichenbachiella sp. TaxID=2184521 RepID=UPI0029671FA9|nr:response regulator [Reichenbachiella sp.]MDW3210537.1 response regulator [Reichenbachiella sp.]
MIFLLTALPCTFSQAQNLTFQKDESFNQFVKAYDSLIYSNELDLAYDLLLEESDDLLSNEIYSSLYYQLLYKKLKSEYLGGNYLESISTAREFLSSYNQRDTLMAYTYYYLGNGYYRFEDYDIAMDCYFKANKIFQETSKFNEVANLTSNIGSIYSNLQEYDQALSYYLKSQQTLIKYGLAPDPYTYAQIARLNTRLRKFDLAKQYLDSGLHYAKVHNDYDEEYFIYRSLASMFTKQGLLQKAKQYHKKAYDGYVSINDIDNALDCARYLSAIDIRLGNYEEALENCEKHLALAYSSKNMNEIAAFSKKIYEILVKQERYKEAIYIQQSYDEVQDSIDRSQKEKNKYKVQMRLEAEKRTVENELLKQQKITDQETIRAQNTLLLSVCIGLILVIVISLIIYRTYIISKRLNLKIQEQSNRLKQLDEAKSRFFANISHDLRTPLTLIMGGIEQVLKSDDLLLTEKAERQLKTGLLNGERIIHLTNEINELIKLEDGKLTLHKKYIDIDKMLKLFVKMFDSMAQLKGIHLSYSKSIFEGPSVLHIDPSQFEKVLFNLITNALKHTKEDDSVTVALNKKGHNLIIAVIDSGEGIPEQNIPYIFERYYQAPDTTFKTQEGFGIGLALVKEIIQKHGAKIEVKSKLGEGSEFVISMPQENVSVEEITFLPELDFTSRTRGLFKKIDEPIAEQIPVVNLARTSDQKRKTVLIVEDHPEIREYIQNIVEVDYNVLTAPNGQRALKVLDKEEVDLIITDLMMPWFDGFELLERLKENDELKKIPALVLSARTSEEDKTKVLSQGVNDFLCKPFKPEELILRIENLLNQKELWNNNNEGALFINNQETLDDIEKSLLKKVESLIFDRIDDPNLSVNCLADEIAVSERKFYRMIKKMTDSTPFEFIKEIRMQYANKILKEKKISSASEVAKAIGMNNVSHFNTQFKKRFGKTPTEFI